MDDLSNWVIEETKTANFGDKRLTDRYGNIVDRLCASPNQSIPASFNGWKETLAAYRFFNHEDVTPEQIMSPHRDATLERIKKEKIVLIPQDTTEIDFTGRKSLSGMGCCQSQSGLSQKPERVCEK